MKIDTVKISDLEEILAIEKAGFNEAEAGTIDAYQKRIEMISDSFLVARNDDAIAGFICGPVTKQRLIEDWMYEDIPHNPSEGGHQMVLTVAVSPDHRGEGIVSKLLSALEDTAKKSNRESIALTCLEDRIPFYEKNGYINQGQANSNHANEVWYNLEKVL